MDGKWYECFKHDNAVKKNGFKINKNRVKTLDIYWSLWIYNFKLEI